MVLRYYRFLFLFFEQINIIIYKYFMLSISLSNMTPGAYEMGGRGVGQHGRLSLELRCSKSRRKHIH